MFAKKRKEFLRKERLTKADPRGAGFELFKIHFNNSVELEYNMEQCYLAMSDKIDWANREGNTFHNDLCKSLNLVGPPGKKTIPTNYFFNKVLEYLINGNKEKKYALSLLKFYATKYEEEGIKEIIPNH
ncbi:hypothetical protein Tco_1307755 [Tanacetum coccineum]